MKELSVRCDAVTRAGSSCRLPAYEPMPTGDGVGLWLCTVHRRLVARLGDDVQVVRDGAGRAVMFEVSA